MRLGRALALAALVVGAAAWSDRAWATPPPRTGTLVVAVGDTAVTPAAEALARIVYSEPDLRPAIDDATARVLVGEAPAEGASPKLRELAEVRGSIAPSSTEAAARKLLASIANDLGARAAIAVSLEEDKPVARILRVAGDPPPRGGYENVLLTATVDDASDGTKAITWPGALVVLKPLLEPRATSVEPRPTEARRKPPAAAQKSERSMFLSPWFWGGLGVVASVGVTVFVLSKAAEGDEATLRLQGRVPQ